MKKIISVLLISCAVKFSVAQSYYTMVQYNKKDVPAVVCEMPFEESSTKDAIDKYFEKLGYKGKKTKDFLMYSGMIIPAIDSLPHDVYVMVDRKSRQEKNISVVTFLIGNGFDSFADDVNAPNIISNTKIYIANLREVVAAYDLELQIAAQEDLVKKNEKKMTNLTEDLSSLQKKKKKIEEEIIQNGIDQNAQKTETARQKQILENLKAKRKP